MHAPVRERGVKDARRGRKGPGAAAKQRFRLAAAQREQRAVLREREQRAVIELQTAAAQGELFARVAAARRDAFDRVRRIEIIQPSARLREIVRPAVVDQNGAVVQRFVDHFIAHERAAAVGVIAAGVVKVIDQQRKARGVVVDHRLALALGKGRGEQRKGGLVDRRYRLRGGRSFLRRGRGSLSPSPRSAAGA